MNWDNDTIMRFLELYQMNPCIWDPQNGSNKNRQTVSVAWENIRENLERENFPCTVRDLKKKKESLMSAYRTYKTKIKKTERLATSAAEVYQPVWFAFAYMDSFLATVYNCTEATRTDTKDEVTIIPETLMMKQESASTTDMNTDDSSDWNQEALEQEDPMPNSSDIQQSSSMTSTLSKRKPYKSYNPPELRAKKQMDDGFNFTRQMSEQGPSKDSDDECYIFGTLIAKKLRKLSEDRRDVMMVKINQLFVDERSDHRT